MTITINDNEVDIADGTTVAALLESQGFPDRGIAVSVNWAVLPRSEWGSAVPADARIDVFAAVQGG